MSATKRPVCLKIKGHRAFIARCLVDAWECPQPARPRRAIWLAPCLRGRQFAAAARGIYVPPKGMDVRTG